MAYTTINKSTDYFNTKLYTGNGSTQSITGVGHQPDFIWVKARDGATNYYHYLQDTVRGTQKIVYSNGNDGEATITAGINTVGSDGWTTGSQGALNDNGDNFVAWNWKAGGATGSSNSNGSITSTVSVNTTAGFSIVKWTGNGVAGASIGHGLGVVPKLIIVKRLNDSANWTVYHASLANTHRLELNETGASTSDAGAWNNQTPTSTVFYTGNNLTVGNNGSNYVAYCFAEKTGYSKFSSYIGNGNADGTFVYTGFKPAFIIIKRDTAGYDWLMYTDKINGMNPMNDYLAPNEPALEVVNNANQVLDIVSNGFKHRGTGSSSNANNKTFFYLAFGQSIVGSNNIPCTAR